MIHWLHANWPLIAIAWTLLAIGLGMAIGKAIHRVDQLEVAWTPEYDTQVLDWTQAPYGWRQR